MHQVAQFDVVLTVGLGHFAQTVLGKNQLTGCGILVVDAQHALLDQAREVVPGVQRVGFDRLGQARPEGAMHIGGQGLEQGRDTGEKVIHRGRRDLRPLGDAVDRQAGQAFAGQQGTRRLEDRVDPRLTGGAGFACGDSPAHVSC
ncbi:hypothetical protein D3C84_878300 [compost metagenome]